MTTSLPAALLGIALLIAPLCAHDAAAASCREELDRFERKLNESGLAATAPERYAELARAAEEAAELRDEALCMERAAELHAELSPGAEDQAGSAGSAPPAAPLLHDAAPVD